MNSQTLEWNKRDTVDWQEVGDEEDRRQSVDHNNMLISPLSSLRLSHHPYWIQAAQGENGMVSYSFTIHMWEQKKHTETTTHLHLHNHLWGLRILWLHLPCRRRILWLRMLHFPVCVYRMILFAGEWEVCNRSTQTHACILTYLEVQVTLRSPAFPSISWPGGLRNKTSSNENPQSIDLPEAVLL